MEMEVMISDSPAVGFSSACSSPYASSPSSPQRISNIFYSAPTSPARASYFFREFENFSGGSDANCPGASPSTINDVDFEFDFSGQKEITSLSADELFDGGKIKPLKPPPSRLQINDRGGVDDSPKSPRSPVSWKISREAWSPRLKKNEIIPFGAAIEQSNPLRISDILSESESETDEQSANSSSSAATKPRDDDSSSSACMRCKLMDLFLFRSVSEGRATSKGKDQMNKFMLSRKSTREGVKNSSFRSMESTEGSVSSRRRRRRQPVSAHEMHYTMNRAVSEEMRKKTSLPYKHGLLGCLGYNPAVPDILQRT